MSGSFLVKGGRQLLGSVRVGGSKNAVLPILAAVLLSDSEIILHNCPHLIDVDNMLRILQHLGCEAAFIEGDTVRLNAQGARLWEMPEHLSRELRSSIFLLGPILGRFGRALFTYPGGCEIGLRPIDLHLKGLRVLNAGIEEAHGYIICKPSRLMGAMVNLDYPSVGATENIMMAAVKAEGRTVIQNAAREPEIEALQDFINAMGGMVYGAGTSVIEIMGVKELYGAEFTVPSDRIVAGTYLAATAMTRGDVELVDVQSSHLQPVLSKLREAGCAITEGPGWLRLRCSIRPLAVKRLDTMPYPGFPTDMQAQFFALSAVSEGTTVIVENVFENRFRHAGELMRMGADITVRDRMAIVHGVERLTGASVNAGDLRGGAALVLAGLAAEGLTRVDEIRYIDRGYEALDRDLVQLGADITRV
jgi:UDP-N-acetylglucosamine 1-carboxyvinyltransferase